MTALATLGWGALGLVVALGCANAASPIRPAEEKWMEAFPAYPKARRLCAEHVSGPGMHISWQSYAVKASPDEVVAFYKQRFPTAKPSETARFEVRGPNEKVLSVHAAGDRFPSCELSPEKGELTVILVSQAVKG